ncbi:MAG: HAD family phosphatase [Nocardiaceae bacterium]|nr:HAD family phosphatase [Nocardiaceae bacterium]
MAQQDIQAVVFDYGGVLTNPVREAIGAWLSAEGIDPLSFSVTLKAWMSRDVPYGTPIHRLEMGDVTIDEFDRLLAAELITHTGAPVDPAGVLARMFAALRTDDDMFGLVKELRELGLRVGLLSNSWGNSYPRDLIDPLFDSIIISSEVRLRKPQPEIYLMAAEQLAVPAETIVFVDDAEPNLIGAQAVGLQTILHESAAQTRAALRAWLPALQQGDA